MKGAFICTWCFDEGLGAGAVVHGVENQFVIEVAAKRSDGQTREAQVSTWRLCRKHADAFVGTTRELFGRNRLAKLWKDAA